MQFKEILYTKKDGIATITLNRPEVLNALNATMMEEWATAIEGANQDEDVRVLVVTGAGRGFCSGADLKALNNRPELPPKERKDRLRSVFQGIPLALKNFCKPYIASINGVATGGGADMASMADIRIASDRARFSINQLRIAGLAIDGGYYFHTRVLGLAKTLELAMTHRFFDAEEALRLGYISKMVPHDQLPEATKELASQLVKGPPIALQLAKRLIYQSLEVSLDKHLEDVEMAWLLNETTEDFKEGPRALLEKRPPLFRGK